MKSMLLSIALLLSTPALMAESVESNAPSATATYDAQAANMVDSGYENVFTPDMDEADLFDTLLDSNIPSDMIVAPKPVSALEAYLKHAGVAILLKYIALKIWLEHQWQSLSSRP